MDTVGNSEPMQPQPKILLLDDDQEFLELYQNMLSTHLPSNPEVKTATTGAKALSLLGSDNFNLLSIDLDMPKMDGLQILSIARRKHPQLRMVVLTGIRDEQFRSRAYHMGVDQYWIKPESDQEIGLLMESFETLVSQEAMGGFRGIQSKSLVDIIQLECLSQSSSLLRITNGRQDAKIWIDKGEVIDAETKDLKAEEAFQKILTWKSGAFEILPPDPDQERTIFTSYQGLLLDTAQAMDEAAHLKEIQSADESEVRKPSIETSSLLVELAQMPGVEFILTEKNGKPDLRNFFGLEDSEATGRWMNTTLTNLQELGELLKVGELKNAVACGTNLKAVLTCSSGTSMCIGLADSISTDRAVEILNNIVTKWDS